MFFKFGKKRVHTPTILQMEITECGAAALSIILAYYGAYLSLEQLRVECGVSRDGSNALNMLEAAERFGLKTEAITVDSLEELKDLPLPFIVFWKFNHMVVVEGIGDSKYYINDPSTGPRTVSKQEFDECFTGVVFLFTPQEEFKKMGKPFSVYKAIKEKLHGEKKTFLFVILASLFLVIPGIMVPGFTKIFIDEILIKQYHDWLPILLLGLLITALLRSLLAWLQQYYFLFLHIKLLTNSTTKFVWHLLRLPVSFFQQRYVGDIQERIDANGRIVDLFASELASSVVNLVAILFYGIIMVLLDWQLTIIAVIVITINLFIFRMISRKIADISHRFLQELGYLSGVEISGLQLIEMLKAMSLDDYFFDRWATNHAKIINTQQRIILINQIVTILPTILLGLASVTVLGYGSWQIMQGQLTVGSLVAFQSLAASFNAPVMSLLALANQIQQIRGDLARLSDIEQHPIDQRLKYIVSTESLTNIPPTKVTVKNLTFGYSLLKEPLIKNLSFVLPPGKCLAIVGKTGSGKSTIVNLICGLYQPWDGTIFINDKPLAEITPQELAATIAFVDQDITLFSGTIAENLTLWQQDYDYQVLEQALQDACILDEINRRGGLSYTISAKADELSGGEKQRLEIARALVAQPKLLILDEATSNLDSVLEHQIYCNIKQRGCTLLIISHRLSTIRDCEEILVIAEGKVVEQGTHDELMAMQKHYHQMINME